MRWCVLVALVGCQSADQGPLNLGQAATDIEKLQAAVARLEAQVGELEADVTTEQAARRALEAAVGSVDTDAEYVPAPRGVVLASLTASSPECDGLRGKLTRLPLGWSGHGPPPLVARIYIGAMGDVAAEFVAADWVPRVIADTDADSAWGLRLLCPAETFVGTHLYVTL